MIVREFTSYLKRVNSTDVHVPVATELLYDARTNPYAIQITFKIDDEEERVWTVSRELLVAGSVSLRPYGPGDVKFRWFPAQDVVMICLRAPQQDGSATHADIVMPRVELRRFVNDTQASYDGATVDCTAMVDGFLKELLG